MNGGEFVNLSLILGVLSGSPLLIRALPLAGSFLAATILLCLATLSGTVGAVLTALGSTQDIYVLALNIPFGPFEFGADQLSAWFLIPINLICGCAGFYGWRYWGNGRPDRLVRRSGIFLGLLYSAMVLVVLARNTILFLMAYELMAVAAYLAMTSDDGQSEVRDAGMLYLIMAHITILALFAFFSLLATHTGGYLFPTAGSCAPSPALATALLVLILVGFGGKAGMMPLHVWLPSAHAAAPSHISAVMSGVILKVGVYGMIRSISLFQQIPLWWGILILSLGVISGVAGVVFALGQHDIKRLLAYHSIENIGIIVMGIGMYCIGSASSSPALMVLGMAGALLHVLNHAVFKALLFFSAGAAIHCSGTRSIDQMGGLARSMPVTACMFGLGAVAICGLPPLNGFVSEFFIYLGFFQGLAGTSGIIPPVMGLAAPLLALIGGLAVACFVKVFGVMFLGYPRREIPSPHEAPLSMRLAMALLALVCIAVGIAPMIVTPLIDAAVAALLPGYYQTPRLAELAPLGWISICTGTLLGAILLVTFWYRHRLSRTHCGSEPTWGCGYLAPTTRMQYTASSFAATIITLFSPFLRPTGTNLRITGLFPTKASFHSHVPEVVLEQVFLPLLNRLYLLISPLRKLQSGLLQHYMFYIFITVLLLLAWGRL